MNCRHVLESLVLIMAVLMVGCGQIDTPFPPTVTIAPTETERPTETVAPAATEPSLLSDAGVRETPAGKRVPLKDWQTDFCDDLCGQNFGAIASDIFTLVVPGKNFEALEVLYDVRNSGWVLVKKSISLENLAGTKGVSFFYKGVGASNSIELKLLLHYPGSTVDTTFGVIWNRATDTGDQWRSHEALYEVDFRCWGPAELCEEHKNTFDMRYVHRIEFGIANKDGDAPGLGKVTFDELMLLFE